MTTLLGGVANPLGAVVHFLSAPLEAVTGVLAPRFDISPTGDRLVDALDVLLPFESPWSRLILATCGDWTAVINNGINAGDGTTPGPALSRTLDVTCVIASHIPRYGPGHENTQLEMYGPLGEPPLMHMRTLSASAAHGQWEWHESGQPLAVEQRLRYTAPDIRDRFDRELLLDYLGALGIPADDDAAYGEAVLLQERASYPRRRVSLAEARAQFL